jgi:hypothetical protein
VGVQHSTFVVAEELTGARVLGRPPVSLLDEPKVALFPPHVFLITQCPLQIARGINMLTKDEIL